MPWDSLLAVVYVLGLVPAWRAIFRVILTEAIYGRPEGEDIAFGVFFASCGCWFWPLIAPFALVWRIAKGDPERAAQVLGGEGRAQKLRRLEKEARDRERRIRDLEREAGIR